MTPKNLAQHRLDPHMPFWQNLKEGSDYFEVTRQQPQVGVCGKRYVFGGEDVAQGNCAPTLDPLVAQKRQQDEQQVAEFVAKGTPPIKLVYDDGGQHPSFRKTFASLNGNDTSLVLTARENRNLGEVSRPEALAAGPREILLDASGQPKDQGTALAYASQPADAPAKVSARAPVTAEVAPAPAPAPAESKPFYQRIFSFGGRTQEAQASPRS
jgi:hypothetical protein